MIFLDSRSTLARHPSKRFNSRPVDQIVGIVVHQTAGRDNPFGTAKYHVGKNHVSETGCPGLLYTFFIRQNGEIHWANDLDAETWSQGGRGTPVPGTQPNKHFLSVVLGGDFNGAGGHIGDDGHPTAHQIHALLCLTQHLTGGHKSPAIPSELFAALSCSSAALYGHQNFGKPACPGVTGQAIVDGIRHHLETPEQWSSEDWQKALVGAGFLTDGDVDGAWGPKSKTALVAFQRSRGLAVDGLRGTLTKSALIA